MSSSRTADSGNEESYNMRRFAGTLPVQERARDDVDVQVALPLTRAKKGGERFDASVGESVSKESKEERALILAEGSLGAAFGVGGDG